jgi:two-component system sensor histidine kinase MtrB
MGAAERVAFEGERPSGRLGSALAGIVRGFFLALTSPIRGLYRWWHRSIQARVVLGVLSLSTVLCFVAGWVLLSQVTHGLLETKKQSALTQATQGFDTANSRLGSVDVQSVNDPGGYLNPLIDVLAPHNQTAGDYTVIVIGPVLAMNPDRPETWAPHQSGPLDVGASIPHDLVARVKSDLGVWWAYSKVRDAATGTSKPAIVVGSQIRALNGSIGYGLVYVFPLQEQEQTLSVVERGMLAAGGVLVVLLSTIAWLVTRQVVTPVRLARRISERLAAGRLEERMHVRGEDDLARLAVSFNKMATGLQQQIRQLEELSRVQRRFVADVSHELRTPLTTVRMASDLLYEARDRFDGPTARSAELLQRELDRFEGLLTDLLEISRFDAGAASLELSEIDLRDVVRRVVDANAAIAHSRGSQVTVRLPDTPATVTADVRRIERVVRNLVVNAIAYGEGRDIAVRVVADGASVSVLVHDHGVGLKPGEEKLVFNRFWRADPARARTVGGTGLGLSIAVEDTALHGGVLDAWGRVGFGSVFRLVLPIKVGAAVNPAPLPLSDDGFEGPQSLPDQARDPARPGAR